MPKKYFKFACEICGTLCMKQFRRAFCSVKCRFMGFVEKTDSCWLWKGIVKQDGYGFLRIAGKEVRAHRASYQIHKSEPRQLVLHNCNVKICVNPDHLYEGTVRDNVNDAMKDGVLRRGNNVNTSKLNENQVLEIRSIRDKSQQEIADMYNVSQNAISHILLRKNWKHI